MTNAEHNSKLTAEIAELVRMNQSGILMDTELLARCMALSAIAKQPKPGEVDLATGLRYPERRV